MTLVVIQARMGSRRLPGKVLRELAGVPMLRHVCRRVSTLGIPVVVATSASREDDAIDEASPCPVFRGSEHDVLGRILGAADWREADVVVRITADCPLWDPALGAATLKAFAKSEDADYADNLGASTDGTDTEVIPVFLLRRAEQEATSTHDREHVTTWLRQQPDLKRLHIRTAGPPVHLSVDTEEDLARVSEIMRHYGPEVTWRQAVATTLCEHCRLGVPHQSNSQTSIGGDDRHPIWDLHACSDSGGVRLDECLAGDLWLREGR